MQRHFHDELNLLKARLLEMSFKVQDAIAKACDALIERNEKLANEVLDGEKAINLLEIEIDEKGHSLFAVGQPMAVDLRLITMMLKMNTDLERIGDHAVNIAEKSLSIMHESPLAADVKIRSMVELVQKMLRDALDAFMKEDVSLAQSVLKRDDEVDQANERMFFELKNEMEKDSGKVNRAMHLMMISHNLERIADLANNIAEDILYWKQALEVRHRIQL